ncbi:hypothetical protein WJX75_000985 [Coccomyxa subellipsoidea]|uniref:Right handed beta helix domain-containing protein n=1 Tax=Coccomyxa subellipsoidea TaxID=248742 RepID=A0ABR2YLS2_9CHLO
MHGPYRHRWGTASPKSNSAGVWHIFLILACSSAHIASGAREFINNPAGSTFDGTAFSTYLATMHQDPTVSGVKLQPGSYQVTPDTSLDAHIVLSCSQQRTAPFEVDLSGSTLIWQNALVGGITLQFCTSVTLHGPATLDYAQSQYPYAQGTIKSVSADNLHYTIQIHAYFLETWQRILISFANSEAGGGVVYDGTTRLTLPLYRRGTDFVVDFSQTVAISANTGLYSIVLVRDPGTVNVNDLVVITQPTNSVGISCDTNSGTTVRDFNLPTAAGFGFYDGTPAGGPAGGNSWLNLILAPSNVLGSDGQLPLMSSIHDGLHSSSGKVGPTINNCQFISTGDDGVAIHGRFFTVAQVNQDEASLILGAPILNTGELNAGDVIAVYTPDARRLGSSGVISVAVVAAPVPSTTIDNVFGGDFSAYSYLKVFLTVWPPGFVGMPFGSFVSAISRNGNGYSITNSLIFNGRGRGFIVRGSQALIQGNRIIHMTDTSLHMAPGVDYSREAGFIENVLVRDNYFEGEQPGMLLAANLNAQTPFIYGNNYNVRFINNTVANSQTPPLTVTTASKIVVQDNRFINDLCSAVVDNTRDYPWQLQQEPLQLANVYGVTFSNNQLIFNSGCPRGPTGQTNLAAPVYLVNVTHIVGAVNPIVSQPGIITIGTATVSSFQTAPND